MSQLRTDLAMVEQNEVPDFISLRYDPDGKKLVTEASNRVENFKHEIVINDLNMFPKLTTEEIQVRAIYSAMSVIGLRFFGDAIAVHIDPNSDGARVFGEMVKNPHSNDLVVKFQEWATYLTGRVGLQSAAPTAGNMEWIVDDNAFGGQIMSEILGDLMTKQQLNQNIKEVVRNFSGIDIGREIDELVQLSNERDALERQIKSNIGVADAEAKLFQIDEKIRDAHKRNAATITKAMTKTIQKVYRENKKLVESLTAAFIVRAKDDKGHDILDANQRPTFELREVDGLEVKKIFDTYDTTYSWVSRKLMSTFSWWGSYSIYGGRGGRTIGDFQGSRSYFKRPSWMVRFYNYLRGRPNPLDVQMPE
jgi:hypothetical protein